MDSLAAKNYAFKRLSTELPSNLYYHSVHHTEDVCHAVDVLSEAEGVTGENLVLLQTAAAFHDIGFIWQYQKNEPLAADLVREVLPGFGYSEKQVGVITSLIMATQIPQAPQYHLHEILCDADLDYLGRDEFYTVGHCLCRELAAHGTVLTLRKWYELEFAFLSQHTYFTQSARAMRDAQKNRYLEEIRDLLRKND